MGEAALLQDVDMRAAARALRRGAANAVCGLSLFGACLLGLSRSSQAQNFVDVTLGSGLEHVPLGTLDFGTGMCAGDFDGDGDLDLIVPDRPGHPIRYFRNDGGMRFVDLTASRSPGPTFVARACQAADIDNDGDLDVLVGNSGQAPQLFVNDGTGRFVDEASARGLVHSGSQWSAGFGDFDNDGWLDLYIGNRFRNETIGLLEANVLYRNVGGGYFVDVTAAAGVAHATGATFIGAFFDHDEDGWPDLFCANDFGRIFGRNELFRNRRDGTFVPIGAAIGADDAIDAMGFDFVDVFQDGDLDFYCTDTQPDHVLRVFDAALGRFVDETARFGLQGGEVGWAAHFADFDNDGWHDLHVVHMNAPNHFYRNPATPRAAGVPWPRTIEASSPTEYQTTAIVADFDDDGRVDVLNRMIQVLGEPVAARGLILQRNIAMPRHWLSIRAVGTSSNASALGARIEVRTPTKRQRQHVRQNVGFLSGNDLRCHFGLGDARSADVIVNWPSGQVQRLFDVPADRTLTVVEPNLRLQGQALVGASCALRFDAPSETCRYYAILLAGRSTPGTTLPSGDELPLAFDGLTALCVQPGNGLIEGNVGALASDHGLALLTIPNLPSASGLRLHAAAFTFELPSFRIGSVSGSAVPIDVR